MASNKLLVEERHADIGNFMVGRLLPFLRKRQVGPFTFIDHMGPTLLGNGNYMEVDQHPHIGLSTLTYLIEGELEHRDSTGTFQIIKPGDVGFMTAGSGVTHTERTPKSKRSSEQFMMHGYQIWVALPKELEETEPRFDFFPSTVIPKWKTKGLSFTLVAGNAFGKSAPLQGYSSLFMVDVYAEKATTLNLKGELSGEVAFVIVKGTILDDGQKVIAGQMLISKTNDECEIHLEANTQVLLFGGEPLAEEHYLLWNFVSHDKKRLRQAKEDWINKRFPQIEGDETYVPIPRF